MNDYVFKDEFLDSLPSESSEIEPVVIKNSQDTEQMQKGEGCLRLVFIQTVICTLIVLTCLLLRSVAPNTYSSIKAGFLNATKSDEITFDDIKNILFSIGNFVFSDEKAANSSEFSSVPQNQASSDITKVEGEGGIDVKVSPDTVSSNAYILTSQISAPTKGIVTSDFGWRIHPLYKTEGFHTGIDIAAKLATPITSAFSGSVYEVGRSEGYGNYIIMKHSETLYTFYGHCDSIKAESGMVIRQGEIIAYMGDTGYSTGPHLHFEIRIDGKSVDPAYVLKGIEGIEF